MYSKAKRPRATLALSCMLILSTLFLLISADAQRGSRLERMMKHGPANDRMSRHWNHPLPRQPTVFRHANEDGDGQHEHGFHENLTDLLKDPVNVIIKVLPMLVPCPKSGELTCIGLKWKHGRGRNRTDDGSETPVPQVSDFTDEGENQEHGQHHGHEQGHGHEHEHVMDRMHEDYENTKVRHEGWTLLEREMKQRARDDASFSSFDSDSNDKDSPLKHQRNLHPVRRMHMPHRNRMYNNGSGHHGHGRGVFIILDGAIEGFAYEEGVEYKLNVSVQAVDPSQVSDYSTVYIMPRPPHHGHHNHSESNTESGAGEDHGEEEMRRSRLRRRRQYAGMRNLRTKMMNPSERDAETSELPLPPPKYILTVVIKLNEIVFQEAVSFSDVPGVSATVNPESLDGNAAGLTGSPSSASSGLSAGAIAGIVVGAVVVAGVVAAAAVYGMRKRGNGSGIGVTQGHQVIDNS